MNGQGAAKGLTVRVVWRLALSYHRIGRFPEALLGPDEIVHREQVQPAINQYLQRQRRGKPQFNETLLENRRSPPSISICKDARRTHRQFLLLTSPADRST